MDKLEYIPGDLVMVDNDIVKVMTRSVNYFLKIINNYDVMFHSGNVYKYSPNELKPIPLTPEILEKNGWKKFKRPYSSDYCYRRKGYPTLNIRSEKEVYFHWGDHDESITTVHQLQHLLFGLGLNSEMEV